MRGALILLNVVSILFARVSIKFYKIYIFKAKIVSMIRKYHNHKPQTTLWHREEEPLNHHDSPGRQIKQSNQLSLPHQDDCNTRTDTKQRTTKHITITDSHNGCNNEQKVNNNRTTALERTAA